MRRNTRILMNQSWTLISNNRELNGFESREAFERAFAELGEVAGDGKNSYFTRLSTRSPFEPGNIRILNCEAASDEEEILIPYARFYSE